MKWISKYKISPAQKEFMKFILSGKTVIDLEPAKLASRRYFRRLLLEALSRIKN